MLYAYPKFSRYDLMVFRLGGAGLANLLFPWARSIVDAKRYNLVIINPTWPCIKIGPILRKENDKRTYIGLFKEAENSIKGIKKTSILIGTTHCSENDIHLLTNHSKVYTSKVFIYNGLNNYFKDILDEHEYIFEQLIKITKENHKTSLSYDFSQSITLHVRLGDFLTTNQHTNLLWFERIVKSLRGAAKKNIKFYLFSDGSNEQLASLINLGNIERLSFGSSIADILALSRSKILIASKGSTFSMWGAYLGRMPFIQPAGGKKYQIYNSQDSDKHIYWEDYNASNAVMKYVEDLVLK